MTLRSEVLELLDRGVSTVDEHAPGWVARAVDEARAHVDLLPDDARAIASAALEELAADEVTAAIAGLGVVALRDGLVALRAETGEPWTVAEATLSLSFTVRRAALHAATGEALAEADRRDAQARVVVAALRRAGLASAKAAIPLLLATVGLPASDP
jgi:hypothetical protein